MFFKIRNGPRFTSDDFRLEPVSASAHRHHNCSWKRPQTLVRSSARLFENDRKIRISVDVPGVKAKDLKVEIQDGILHLTGRRKFDDSSLMFHKSYALDMSRVDTTKLKANLSDGVLVVTAPKQAKQQAQNIEVTEISDDEDDDSVAMEEHAESDKGESATNGKCEPDDASEGDKKCSASTSVVLDHC